MNLRARERLLRQHGVAAGAPARRRHLALVLDTLTEDAMQLLATLAAAEGPADAGQRLEGWLLDGSWTTRARAAQDARRAAEAVAEPVDIRRGRCACLVLGDRIPIAAAAAATGLTAAEAAEAVAAGAAARGIGEARLQELLGIAGDRRQPVRPAARPRPTSSTPAATAAPAAAPRNVADELAELYRLQQRRPPSHVLQAFSMSTTPPARRRQGGAS